MKAGIVTIYDTENMGNRLQNYALQQALSRYADEVVTLKNKPRLESRLSNWKQGSALADSVLLNRLLGKHRKAKLLRFNKRYIRISRRCYWCNDAHVEIALEDQCDVYCAGSDQIWNSDFYRSGMFNYLGFADENAAFAYAASFGIEQIPDACRDAVRTGLSHLRHISVREDTGKKIVEEMTSRDDVQVLVDPTMLLTAREWTDIQEKPSAPLPEHYLLTYFLGTVSPERRDAIARQAKERQQTVVNLMDPDSPFHTIGPEEFLYLIAHADTVCTDSFHGSVFSFLFRRPLVIFSRVSADGSHSNMGSRLKTFCETFHLEHCAADQNKLPDIPAQADYAAGLAVLEAERAKAFAFLEQVFSECAVTGGCET